MKGVFMFYLFGVIIKILTILIGSLLLFGLISSLFRDVVEGLLIKPVIQLKMLDFEITLPPNSVLVYMNLTKLGVASQSITDICINKTCVCALSFSAISLNKKGDLIMIRTKYTYPNGTPVNITINITNFDYNKSVGGEVVVLGKTLLGIQNLQDKDFYQKLLFLYNNVQCLEVKKIYYLESSYILAMMVNIVGDRATTLVVSYQDLGGSGLFKRYLLTIRGLGKFAR